MKRPDPSYWLDQIQRWPDSVRAVPELRGRPEIVERLLAWYAAATPGLKCTTLHLLLSVDAPAAVPLLRAEAAHLATRDGHGTWCPTRALHPDGPTRYLAVLEPHVESHELCAAVEELDRHRHLSLETLLWLSARRSANVARQASSRMAERDGWSAARDEVKRLARALPVLGEWLFDGHTPSQAELVACVRALSESASLSLRRLAVQHATRVFDKELVLVAGAMLRREPDEAFRRELVSVVIPRAHALDLDPLLAVTELGDDDARRRIIEKLPVDREPAAYRRAQDLVFSDPSPEVRLAAIRHLVAARELPYVGVPMRLTLSRDPGVRFWGIRWLQRHPEPEARARLVKLATTDPQPGVRVSAAKRVAGWDPEADRDALLAMTRDTCARVRRIAVNALAKRPGPEARARFRELIASDGDATVRAVLIAHFKKTTDAADLPAVEHALALARAWAEGRYGRERTVHALEVARYRLVSEPGAWMLYPGALLHHPSGDVRRRAALDVARSEVKPGRSRPGYHIDRAMREDNGRPRLRIDEAAVALCELGDERELPRLVATLMRTNERPLREGDALRVGGFVAAGGLASLKLILREMERLPAAPTDSGHLAMERAARCVAAMRDPHVDLELTALCAGRPGWTRTLAERALAQRRRASGQNN